MGFVVSAVNPPDHNIHSNTANKALFRLRRCLFYTPKHMRMLTRAHTHTPIHTCA